MDSPRRRRESTASYDLISRDEILELEGVLTVVVLARCGDRWLPLQPDYSQKKHSLAGMVCSGYVVRPGTEGSAVPFRLEVPQRGDLTRVFLRAVRNDAILLSDDGEQTPSYRQLPFLLFVDGRLCVRFLPSHAIASASRALKSGAWERMELRAPFTSLCVDDETSVAHAAFVLHGGSRRRRVQYNEQDASFMNRSTQQTALKETWFAFARYCAKPDFSLMEAPIASQVVDTSTERLSVDESGAEASPETHLRESIIADEESTSELTDRPISTLQAASPPTVLKPSLEPATAQSWLKVLFALFLSYISYCIPQVSLLLRVLNSTSGSTTAPVRSNDTESSSCEESIFPSSPPPDTCAPPPSPLPRQSESVVFDSGDVDDDAGGSSSSPSAKIANYDSPVGGEDAMAGAGEEANGGEQLVPFELTDSVVTDSVTGERLTHEKACPATVAHLTGSPMYPCSELPKSIFRRLTKRGQPAQSTPCRCSFVSSCSFESSHLEEYCSQQMSQRLHSLEPNHTHELSTSMYHFSNVVAMCFICQSCARRTSLLPRSHVSHAPQVVRGSTRLETLHFRVNVPLIGARSLLLRKSACAAVTT